MMEAVVFCGLVALFLLSGVVFRSRYNVQVTKRNKKYETVKGLNLKHVVVGPGVVLGEENIEDAKIWCEVRLLTSRDAPNHKFFKQDLNDLKKLRIRSSSEEEGIHYNQVLAYANAWRSVNFSFVCRLPLLPSASS